MTAPTLLRGAAAIGAHLGITAKRASHLLRQRLLPAFRMAGNSGALCATAAGLDDWRALESTRDLLN